MIEITAVTCPRCGQDGGHEQVEAAPDGSYRALLCRKCHVSWKAYG